MAHATNATDLDVVARTSLPTRHGVFEAWAFEVEDGVTHLALVMGDVATSDVLVRLHSECLTGDVLGSLRCDCGEQLDAALAGVAAAGRGVLVYLRGHEGRGIGLANKLRAYQLQERGLDTVDANLALGCPIDQRDYRPAVLMLRRLGVRSVALMTNNPDKVDALGDGQVECTRVVPMPASAQSANTRYLRTKVERLGHLPALTSPLVLAAVNGPAAARTHHVPTMRSTDRVDEPAEERP